MAFSKTHLVDPPLPDVPSTRLRRLRVSIQKYSISVPENNQYKILCVVVDSVGCPWERTCERRSLLLDVFCIVEESNPNRHGLRTDIVWALGISYRGRTCNCPRHSTVGEIAG